MATIAGVIFAVKDWDEEFQTKMEKGYSLHGSLPDIIQVTNDEATGICAKYNKGIETALYQCDLTHGALDYSWIIFSHDDVIIKSKDLSGSLNKAHALGADIVCVAGNAHIPAIDPGYWWDGLTTAKFRGSGAVIHRTPDTDDMYHIESYGPYPQKVAAFDGLWFAVKTKTLMENPKLRFDESYPGYHYYDVDFAATARSLDCQIWTADILLLHNKWGRGIEDTSFKEHQKIFIDKWSKKKHLYYRGDFSSDNNFVSNTSAFNVG